MRLSDELIRKFTPKKFNNKLIPYRNTAESALIRIAADINFVTYFQSF